MFRKIFPLVVVLFFLPLLNSSYSREIEVYFTPSYAAEYRLVYLIKHARRTIDVAMYSFTNRRFAQALVEAKRRGVKVRVLLDRSANTPGENKYTKYAYLKSHGIVVAFAKPHSRYGVKGILHDKFAVFDDSIVETGSANWTASAFVRNDENILIINRVDIANVYEEEFEDLWRRRRRRH